MSETFRPYIESDADDKETDKKDKKKRAEHSGGLLASQAVERAPAERPLKLGSELLKPLSVELPKAAEAGRAKDRADEVAPDRDTEQMPAEITAEQSLPIDDLQRLQAELAALNPEAADDDGEPDKPKKAAKASVPREDAATEAPAVEIPKAKPDRAEAAFDEITHAPELADLAALPLPEATVAPGAAVQEASPEAVLPTLDKAPEVTDSDDPDVAFNDIVEQSLGEVPPGTARFHELAPGEPPIDAGAGDTLPPVPPTIEGGDWAGGDEEPWRQPAGGLGGSSVAEAVSAVDARRELDDLYHTSRENGLAAAVGLLGLGLVIEHIWAKRRDKRLKKELTAQGRHLKKTDQTVRQQHYTLQATQRKLERLRSEQTATTEQIRGAGDALAAAAATGGIAERHATKLTSAQEHVLADRLEHSRELGVAMTRNPELQKESTVRAQHLREMQQQAYESAQSTLASQEQQITQLQHEVNYERLQSKYSDNGHAGKHGSHGVSSDASGMPMLPMPQEQLPSGMAAEHLLEAQGSPDKPARTAAAIIMPVAVATILVILAAVLVMAFIR